MGALQGLLHHDAMLLARLRGANLCMQERGLSRREEDAWAQLIASADHELAARGERVVEVPIGYSLAFIDTLGKRAGVPPVILADMEVKRRYAFSRLPDAPKPPAEKHLKCWPEFFEVLASGVKTFDIREERDRNFQVGDILIMDEYDIETDVYSGRRLGFEVTFCLRLQPWVPEGYVAMGLKPHPLPLPDAPDPVAVRPWRIRPNAGRPYDVCGYCQWTIKEGSDHCAECGKIVGERRELPEPGKVGE